jgi:hypothetical protein
MEKGEKMSDNYDDIPFLGLHLAMIGQVVQDIYNEYFDAVRNEEIKSPIAYTLYHTWEKYAQVNCEARRMEEKMNLKKETLDVLLENGKTPQDIRWIGTREYKIPIELFWKLADEEYDNGCGSTEVAVNLVIVGDGWWLDRREYDGSEWWEYNADIEEPSETKEVNTIINCDSYINETLDEMNGRMGRCW